MGRNGQIDINYLYSISNTIITAKTENIMGVNTTKGVRRINSYKKWSIMANIFVISFHEKMVFLVGKIRNKTLEIRKLQGPIMVHNIGL